MIEVAAGIDIGGGSTKIGLVDANGHILHSHNLVTPDTDEPEIMVGAYLDTIKKWLIEYSKLCLSAVGVGVPGHVVENKSATDLCNLSVLNRFPLAHFIHQELNVPVVIENDATFAGVGEYLFGAGQGSHRFFMATLGTGIGGVFINNGTIITTANGTMGDAGHMIIDYDMRYSCRKGCLGCIESVASGIALDRDISIISAEYPDSYLGLIRSKSGQNPTVRDLIEGSKVNDQYCLAKMDETARWIGMWSCSLVHIFGPDLMAFGGGWSAAGQSFIDQIHGYSKSAGIEHYYRDLSYVQATLGNRAGIVGAAVHALRYAHSNR